MIDILKGEKIFYSFALVITLQKTILIIVYSKDIWEPEKVLYF